MNGTTLKGWKTVSVIALVLSLSVVMLIPVSQSGSMAMAAEDSGVPSHGLGIKAAGWALTIPYAIAKVIYATTGTVVGGFAYVLSGGDTDAAKAVWVPSLYGTYIITPEHLSGHRPVRFLGKPETD